MDQQEIYVTQEAYDSLTKWQKIKFWFAVACTNTIVYKTTEERIEKINALIEKLERLMYVQVDLQPKEQR